MNLLDYTFQIWDRLYDKSQDTRLVIENYFHYDYTQCINGVVMNRSEYIDHVEEQKKNIKSIVFKCKKFLLQHNELFMIYNAKGKNNEGCDVEAEIIAHFEFKDNKVFRIHGQVQLLKGNLSDVDMND